MTAGTNASLLLLQPRFVGTTSQMTGDTREKCHEREAETCIPTTKHGPPEQYKSVDSHKARRLRTQPVKTRCIGKMTTRVGVCLNDLLAQVFCIHPAGPAVVHKKLSKARLVKRSSREIQLILKKKKGNLTKATAITRAGKTTIALLWAPE